MMKMRYLNRIAAFLMALACVVVCVLPGFVVPAQAVDLTFYDPSSASIDYGVLDATVPSGAAGPLIRYNWPLFSDSNWVNNGYRFFRINKNNATTDDVIAYTDKTATVYSGSGDDIYISASFLKGKAVYSPYLSLYQIPVLYNADYLAYYDFIDMTINVMFNYNFHSQTVNSNFYFRFYDEEYNEVSSKTGFIFGLTGEGSRTVNYSYAIPEDAKYFDFYIFFSLTDLSDGLEYTFTLDDFDASFYAYDIGYVEPTEPTDPTDPSTDTGDSGGDTGDSGSSGSGSDSSGGSSSFDDSGIISSVESSADKIITEIGGDIENQTQQITNSIAEQNGILTHGFNDLYDVSDDILAEGERTNDNLETMIGTGTEGDELEAGSDSLDSESGKITDFETEQQEKLNSYLPHAHEMITFTKFTSALAFVQSVMNMTFSGLGGDVNIIFSLPLYLGILFFACSRVPGITRGMSRASAPPKSKKGA